MCLMMQYSRLIIFGIICFPRTIQLTFKVVTFSFLFPRSNVQHHDYPIAVARFTLEAVESPSTSCQSTLIYRLSRLKTNLR